MSWNIVNVVATADLAQRVDIQEIAEIPYTIHDSEIYGGRVTYLKTPQMYGKVTIFPSGKLISVGTKSPEHWLGYAIYRPYLFGLKHGYTAIPCWLKPLSRILG